MNTESVFCKCDEFIHIHIYSRTTVRSCSHSALSVSKWKKRKWHYFFEKVTQIFSRKLQSNALLY